MKQQATKAALIFLWVGCFQWPGLARKVTPGSGEVTDLETTGAADSSSSLEEDASSDAQEFLTPQALVQEQAILENEPSNSECFDHTCSQGWLPKIGHHLMNGSSDEACCDKTCEKFTCSHPYVSNESYYGNVGNSNEECCDLTCHAVKCASGQKIPEEKLNLAALTKDECCMDTCEKVRCDINLVPVDSKKESIHPEGEAQKFCCQPTCAAFTCDYHGGYVFNQKTRSLTGVSQDKCCLPTCKLYDCPDGYAMPPSKEWLAKQDASSCCDKQCKGHKCGAHWVPDPTKASLVGDTNEQCCEKTCKLYDCNPGWTRNPEADGFVNVDDPTCCLKQCVQYQDKCTGNYAPSSSKHDIVGQSKELCCQKTCGLYTCNATNMLAANPQSIVAFNEAACCEDKECASFRNKTATDWRGCNSRTTEGECDASFTVLHNNRTNGTDVLSCWWNSELEVCQVGGPEPAFCKGMEHLEPAPLRG